MRTIKFLAIILVAVLVLDSCRKIEKLPNIPYIEFTSFAVFDTLDILGNINKAGRLKFYFEDGDGDVGLKQPSDIQPDTTNMFLELYRKTDGNMVLSTNEADPLLPSSSYRIPYMERLGQNKILKGTISVILPYLDYSPTDTVRYDFIIKDRALNKSNVASTSEIVISANNIYTK
ncbi:MAG: hypothetical protein Q7J06_01970 [Bacteroidales bacterium]|nr:hypothetical protein [Bacteroidales bacterium]